MANERILTPGQERLGHKCIEPSGNDREYYQYLQSLLKSSGLIVKDLPSGGEVKEGGVFRLGSSSNIDSLNPFVAFQADAYSTFEYIYPYLVQFNPKLQFVADFASSWQHSPDGTIWTFHTQPNAKWSDGKPLTAADVAWTGNTILKFKKGAAASLARARPETRATWTSRPRRGRRTLLPRLRRRHGPLHREERRRGQERRLPNQAHRDRLVHLGQGSHARGWCTPLRG
jgi:hypothetical protein